MKVTFNDGTKDNKVFFWCLSIKPSIDFLENQRLKLIEKYGSAENGVVKVKDENLSLFSKDITDIWEMDVQEDIKPIPFSSDLSWFENCTYLGCEPLDGYDKLKLINIINKEQD